MTLWSFWKYKKDDLNLDSRYCRFVPHQPLQWLLTIFRNVNLMFQYHRPKGILISVITITPCLHFYKTAIGFSSLGYSERQMNFFLEADTCSSCVKFDTYSGVHRTTAEWRRWLRNNYKTWAIFAWSLVIDVPCDIKGINEHKTKIIFEDFFKQDFPIKSAI